MTFSKTSQPPEVGSQTRSKPSVEVYRSVYNKMSWRVVALAEDDSERALREAKALALTLEQEIHDELLARLKQRRSDHG